MCAILAIPGHYICTKYCQVQYLSLYIHSFIFLYTRNKSFSRERVGILVNSTVVINMDLYITVITPQGEIIN
jgi:hypothetical protein